MLVVVVRGGGGGGGGSERGWVWVSNEVSGRNRFRRKKKRKREGAYNNAQRTKGTLHQSSKPPSINTTPPNKGDKLRQGHPLPSPSYRGFHWRLCCVSEPASISHISSPDSFGGPQDVTVNSNVCDHHGTNVRKQHITNIIQACPTCNVSSAGEARGELLKYH